MSEKELEKIELIVEKFEKMVQTLRGKNYDFTRFLVSENFFTDFVLKIECFEEEKLRQDKIINCVKEVTRDSVKDYFQQMTDRSNFEDYFQSVIRVEDYKNYYIVWLCGIPCINNSFIFDKKGELLFSGNNVCELDEENFTIIKYDIKKMREVLYHYQFNDSKFDLVNSLDNVIDIDYNDFFNSDSLIVCSYGESKLLYNYQKKEVVLPSFVNIYSDLGNFNKFEFLDKQKYVRIVEKIYTMEDYKPLMVSKLEYLVDRNGFLCPVGIFDFEHYNHWSLFDRGSTQKEIFSSIYEEVRSNYMSSKIVVNKKIKQQN